MIVSISSVIILLLCRNVDDLVLEDLRSVILELGENQISSFEDIALPTEYVLLARYSIPFERNTLLAP